MDQTDARAQIRGNVGGLTDPAKDWPASPRCSERALKMSQCNTYLELASFPSTLYSHCIYIEPLAAAVKIPTIFFCD